MQIEKITKQNRKKKKIRKVENKET